MPVKADAEGMAVVTLSSWQIRQLLEIALSAPIGPEDNDDPEVRVHRMKQKGGGLLALLLFVGLRPDGPYFPGAMLARNSSISSLVMFFSSWVQVVAQASARGVSSSSV